MSVVVDANLIAALVLPLPYSEATTKRIAAWKGAEEDLFAPLLLEYELASMLRKAIVGGLMTSSDGDEALRHILALDIQTVPPTPSLHQSALRWAEQLGRFAPAEGHCYDGVYFALADDLQLPLWTADMRLAHSAGQAGLTWVHWIGESAPTSRD